MTMALNPFQSFDEEAYAASRDPAAEAAAKLRAEALAEGALLGRREGWEEGFEAGRAQGVEDGLVEGRRQGEAAARMMRDAAQEAIAAGLTAAEAARSESERRLAAAAGAALRAATAALLPRLARRGLADEIALLAEEILARAAAASAALRVAPELCEEAEAALTELGLGPTTPEIRPDPGLAPTTARLEWRDGFAEFDAEDAAARILARLDAAASEPEAAAAEAAPTLV